MKIYNSLTIDMVTGEILHEDSFDYNGPLAECKGKDVIVPGPTKEETDLQRMQLQELQKQSQMQEDFMPYYLESMGFGRDEQGKLYKLPEPPKDPLEQAYYDRQLQALNGELPVSPAMEKQLADERSKTVESLNQKLGSNWNTTTAGIQALSEFDKKAELLREEARRGQITTGEALLESRAGFNQNAGQQDLSNMANTGAYFINPGAYQAALQPYQQQRSEQTQAMLYNAQNSSNSLSGMMQLGGTLGAAFMMMPTARSSREYKEDIRPVEDDKMLEALLGTTVYNWKYKGDTDEHTGPVTEESPRQIVTRDGKKINISDAIGLLMSSVKALNKKVEARA